MSHDDAMILRMVLDGCSRAEIARRLGVSESDVTTRLRRLLEDLAARRG